ncbi:hypothetical protein OC861_003014 [Tilletia horrida]|nr:hypothetical protein OC861_003014 [Tilletia horrida]
MSSSGAGRRPSLSRRGSSSSAASTHSNRRISLEGKFASLTRKLSFSRDRTSSSASSTARPVPPSENPDPVPFQAERSSRDLAAENDPHGPMSFEDIHDEHIVRSSQSDAHGGPDPSPAPQLERPPAPASILSSERSRSPPPPSVHSSSRRTDLPPIPPVSLDRTHSTASTSAKARSSSGKTVSAASLGPPPNPFRRQMPRILSFFISTTIAVLFLQRIHTLLALTVALSAVYMLWKQLERAGADELWEAEWRSIESKAAQSSEIGETAQWINHCLRIIWPLLNSELFTPFVDLLEDSLMREVQNLGVVHGCRVEDLDQGRIALQIKGFRILDSDASAFVGSTTTPSAPTKSTAKTGEAEDTGEYINLEVSFSYRGAKRKGTASAKANAGEAKLAQEVENTDASMEARENIHMLLYMMIGLQKIAAVEIPVWVSVLGIEGKVRLRVQILPNPPFAKTVAITFPSLPALELSARPLGRKMLIDAMQLPLVSKYILHSIENVIKGFISPRAYTVDVPALLGAADGPQHTYALGVVVLVLHEGIILESGPALASHPRLATDSRSDLDGMDTFTRLSGRILCGKVFDADRFSADDALGKVEVSIDRLIRAYHSRKENPDVSKIFECREDALQPMVRGGRVSGTLKYSVAFFGLAMAEGHSMSPHRQAMLKNATTRSFGMTPMWERGGSSDDTTAFAALKAFGQPQKETEEHQVLDLSQFETPFDRFLSKHLGLSADEKILRQRYERKQRVQKLVQAIEGAEAAHIAPPQQDRPSGILVWHIHNLDGLEVPSTQRTLRSNRSSAKTKLSTAEDHSESSGSRKMPSSYVQVILNDVAVFKTRTKPLNTQPFVNSGSERWVSDWTQTRIDFVVRDARQRESDAIIGVVGLRLVDVLKDSGRVTDQWAITGGVGYGKIRLSLLFRSLDITIPKVLSGWNIGVLEVGACRVSGLAASEFQKRECSLLFECGNASAETDDVAAITHQSHPGPDAGTPTVEYVWSLDQPVKVAVRNRYPANLFITLRSDRSLGRHVTHAFAMLPLNRIPDDTQITRRVPIFHTHNTQTFEQETMRAMTFSDQLASNNVTPSRWGPILEEISQNSMAGVAPRDIVGASIRHVGWLQITCVFNAGCGPEHRSLVSGDPELRMVYESLFALVDAGQRRPPTTAMSKTRRRKLSLELAGAELGEEYEGGAQSGGLTHRRVVSLDPTGSPSQSVGPSRSSTAMESLLPPSTEDGDEVGEDELFGEGSEAAHRRVLRRTERGAAQVGVVRTMAFLKQSGEDAFAKMKTRMKDSSSSNSRRRLSKLESEGVSHL